MNPPSERQLHQTERALSKLPRGAQRAVGGGAYMRLDSSGGRRFQYRRRSSTHSGQPGGTYSSWQAAYDACLRQADIETDAALGIKASTQKMRDWTIDLYAEKVWWTDCTLHLDVNTLLSYRGGLKNLLPHIKGLTLAQLETEPLRILEIKKALAAAKTYIPRGGDAKVEHKAAIDRALQVLSIICGHAVESHVLVRNPMAGVRRFNRRRGSKDSKAAPSHRPIRESEVKPQHTAAIVGSGMVGNPPLILQRRLIPELVVLGLRPSDILAMRHRWWRDRNGAKHRLEIDSAVKDLAGFLIEGEPKTGERGRGLPGKGQARRVAGERHGRRRGAGARVLSARLRGSPLVSSGSTQYECDRLRGVGAAWAGACEERKGLVRAIRQMRRLLIVALLGLASSAGSAQAAPSPQLAIVGLSVKKGAPPLYIFDGSSFHPATMPAWSKILATAGTNVPVFSANGDRMAWNINGLHGWAIYGSTSAGAGIARLAFTPPSDAAFVDNMNLGPSFSPDGETIAFETTRDRDNPERVCAPSGGIGSPNVCAWWYDGEVYLMNADGSNQRFLTVGANPVFSPDGKWIAYETDSGYAVIPASGGTPRVFPETGATAFTGGATDSPVVWAPDSSAFVFDNGRGIFRQSLSGGASEQMTTDRSDRDPVYLADGTLAFVRPRNENAAFAVCAITPGSNTAQLLLDPRSGPALSGEVALISIPSGVPLRVDESVSGVVAHGKPCSTSPSGPVPHVVSASLPSHSFTAAQAEASTLHLKVSGNPKADFLLQRRGQGWQYPGYCGVSYPGPTTRCSLWIGLHNWYPATWLNQGTQTLALGTLLGSRRLSPGRYQILITSTPDGFAAGGDQGVKVGFTIR